MAPKRKEDAAEEAPSKVAKVEEETKDAEMKEEEPKEKETDDKKDARPAIKEPIGFDTVDSTLNVIPTHNGRALMCMSDSGMQFLIAGARANVGMKAGRYFYEVKVIEALSHWMPSGVRNPTNETPQLVRVGFSTAGSSLVLGEDENGVCIDNHGVYTSFPTAGGAQKKSKCQGCVFGVHEAIGVLLNLDAKSPNANTISLFRNGTRLSEPQALPDHLKGQVLFPHVAFRNVTVHVNFGKEALAAPPFKCRMLQEAAQADVKDGKLPVPKSGKYDVLYPVGFPDEGTFEWLDSFLKKNPQYTELSDRAILDWCAKSGICKDRRGWKDQTGSNDRPIFSFAAHMLNDGSLKRAVYSVAPHFARHYVVMEVKENLVQNDRAQNLKRFKLPHFKAVANVVMGDPKGEVVTKTHEKLLVLKQQKLDADWKKRKVEMEKRNAEKQKKKEVLRRQKQLAEENRLRREAAEKKRTELQEKRRLEVEAKKKAEAEAKKKEEEDAKKKEEASAEGTEENKEGEKKDVDMKAEGTKEDTPKADVEMKEEKKEDEEEIKKEEAKEEVKKEEEKKEEEDPELEEETMETEPPKAELTAEDKKQKFVVPTGQKDLTEPVLNQTFGFFSIPAKDEGFDEIKYEWDDEGKSKAYLKKWVLDRKISSRVDKLVPGAEFNTELAAFKKSVDEYQAKQKAYNMSKPKKLKPKKDDDEAKDEEKNDDAKKDGDEDAPKKEEADIFSVSDVCDIGDGEPLFANFVFEDWALFTLRYECYLLTAHFMKDVNDAERVGIHQANFPYYYNRYFKRQFTPRAYAKESLEEVFELVKDAVEINAANGVVICKLEEDKAKSLSELLKLQEENRRERQRRIDAGDETVRLDFDILRQQLGLPSTKPKLAPRIEAQQGMALMTPSVPPRQSNGPAIWVTGERAEDAPPPQPVKWQSKRALAGGAGSGDSGGMQSWGNTGGGLVPGQGGGQKQWEYAAWR